MMLSMRQAFAWLCAVWLATGSSSVLAAIMYGDFSDIPPGIVMYTDVTESSGTDPVPPPRFGPPDVRDNTLDFRTMQFAALSEDDGADLFDGQLNFGMMVLQNASGVAGGFDGLVIDESGDFTLFGAGSSATAVGAGIFAEVEILAVDGAPLATPITVVGSTQFSTDLNASPGLNQPWGNSLLVDFGPALNNAGIDPEFGVTKARVVLDDTLVAVSEPNTLAFIAKKDFKVTPFDVEPNPNFEPIPEPTTAVIAMALVAGLCVYRRAF